MKGQLYWCLSTRSFMLVISPTLSNIRTPRPQVKYARDSLLRRRTHLQTLTAKSCNTSDLTVCLQSSLAMSGPGTNTIGELQ